MYCMSETCRKATITNMMYLQVYTVLYLTMEDLKLLVMPASMQQHPFWSAQTGIS